MISCTIHAGERPKKSAVMQLCAGNSHCFVMHIFHSGIPPTLRALLADRSYVKVPFGGRIFCKITNGSMVTVNLILLQTALKFQLSQLHS